MKNGHILVNTYFIDPEGAHIVLTRQIDPDIFDKLVQLCPAGLYWRDEKGCHYDYTGCLECGACRIIGNDLIFSTWNLPRGAYGVDYGASGK